MDVRTEAALSETALLKPRQSLQNMGQKKEEDTREDQGFQAFGPDGFTFLDFLDIVNPLQHIPVISTLDREMTGDQIDPGSRIAGGTLFGGPIGAIVATANVTLNETTGKDMGDHIMAFLSAEGEGERADPAIMTAAGDPTETATMAGFTPLSPIAANMEVLEWARREASLMAGTQAPAAALNPATRPIEEARAQSVENRKTSAGSIATATQGGATHIATNSEVVDWARSEALLNGAARQDQALVRDQEQNLTQDHARQKKVASGLTHQQLSGAAAPSGGWFSETMLTALASYQDSAGLGNAKPSASSANKNIDELDLRPDD